MQDNELIKKIQEDDKEAFKELINRHKQQVFKIAIGFLHDKAQADDVVQDVFVKFWEIRNDFELNAKFSTWLYRVTSNMSINVLRRSKIFSFFSYIGKAEDDNEKTEFENTIKDESIKNAEEIFRNEHLKTNLKNAIDSLPKNQRIAFVLNKYQEFSYKEISEIMEVSLASVESLIHRAKMTLQKKLLKTYKSLLNEL